MRSLLRASRVRRHTQSDVDLTVRREEFAHSGETHNEVEEQQSVRADSRAVP